MEYFEKPTYVVISFVYLFMLYPKVVYNIYVLADDGAVENSQS
jgi:hypothetical protein